MRQGSDLTETFFLSIAATGAIVAFAHAAMA
jgi:hypothetical protein